MSSVGEAIPVDVQPEEDHPQDTQAPPIDISRPPSFELPENGQDNQIPYTLPDTSQEELDSPPAYEAGSRLIRSLPTKSIRYTLRRRFANLSDRNVSVSYSTLK